MCPRTRFQGCSPLVLRSYFLLRGLKLPELTPKARFACFGVLGLEFNVLKRNLLHTFKADKLALRVLGLDIRDRSGS